MADCCTRKISRLTLARLLTVSTNSTMLQTMESVMGTIKYISLLQLFVAANAKSQSIKIKRTLRTFYQDIGGLVESRTAISLFQK
jgi:hypothetical protein